MITFTLEQKKFLLALLDKYRVSKVSSGMFPTYQGIEALIHKLPEVKSNKRNWLIRFIIGEKFGTL